MRSSRTFQVSDLGLLADGWRGALRDIGEDIFWINHYQTHKEQYVGAVALHIARYLDCVRAVSEIEERFIQLGSEVQYFPDGRRRIVHRQLFPTQEVLS